MHEMPSLSSEDTQSYENPDALAVELKQAIAEAQADISKPAADGFSRKRATETLMSLRLAAKALEESGNDPKAAVAWLMEQTDGDELEHAENGSGHNVVALEAAATWLKERMGN